jgi:GntR family transcriptional regulator
MMDQIKYYIASGALKRGDQLPSVRELAQALSVNPTTVVKTYTELEHEQVIELRHGKGAFVTSNPARFTSREKQQVLRRMARQLAVEAGQLGAGLELVQELIEEEWNDLYGDSAELNRRNRKF